MKGLLDRAGNLPSDNVFADWGGAFDLCVYSQQSETRAQWLVKLVKLLVTDEGNTLRYERKVDAIPRPKMDLFSKVAPSFVKGFEWFQKQMRKRGQTASDASHIAVVTDPEYAGLMRLARISIVLCGLPPEYGEFPKIELPYGPDPCQVLNLIRGSLCQRRNEEADRGSEEGNGSKEVALTASEETPGNDEIGSDGRW